MSGIMGMLSNAYNSQLGTLGRQIGLDIWGENREQQRTRDNMRLQNQLQQQLNQQGHDLQYDMWNKTNYKAQMEHMRKAGLNPALMYGMSGGGGSTTGSQSGGSQAMGQAPRYNPMDIANLALVKAQNDKIRDDIAHQKWQRGELGDAQIGELNSRTKANIADAGLKKAGINLAEGQLNKVNAEIAKINVEKIQIERITELDYGGNYGKNLTQNVVDMLGLTPNEEGAMGLDDAGKVALAVGGLAVLRSPAAMSKLSKPAREKAVKGINKVSSWLISKWNKFRGKNQKVIYNN